MISRGPEIEIDRRKGRILRALRHEDRDHLFLGIVRPGGAEAAVPAVASGRREKPVAPCDDADAEAPAAILPILEQETRYRLLRGRQLICSHELDGGPRQDARRADACLC